MIYACDNCHFLFFRAAPTDRCPDCGKERVRSAAQEEILEFKRRATADLWQEQESQEEVK